MASKKKKPSHLDPLDVLEGKVNIGCHELIRLIHRVNPTKEGLRPEETAARYRLKSRLQALLIDRFGDRLLVVADDTNPDLVSINARYFDDNACHALLSELDDKTRSWIQQNLDVGPDLPTSSQPSASAGKTAREANASPPAALPGEGLDPDELLRLGRLALENYEYDECALFFRRAFAASRGDTETAVALLAYLVDHIASYDQALSLVPSLSAKARQDPDVKVLLALAAVHCGHWQQTLAYLDRSVSAHPRTAEVLVLGIRHFLKHGDGEQAARLLTSLKLLDNPQLQPEITKMQGEIEALQKEALAPMEHRMVESWEQGREEEALTLAEELLRQWPRHQGAAKIIAAVAERRLTGEIDRLLQLADQAREAGQFQREVDLLKKSMELGAGGVGPRLDQAREAARRQQMQTAAEGIIELWAEGNKAEALLRYATMPDDERRFVASRTGDPHFSWLDQILAAPHLLKPERIVEAVLALGQAMDAWRQDGDPQEIITALRGQGKALQAVAAAGILLGQAEKKADALQRTKAQRLLHQAGQFLAGADHQQARLCLDGIKPGLLGDEELRHHEDLAARLTQLETIAALRQSHAGEADKGNHFVARDLARSLAGMVTQDEAPSWHEKVHHHQDAINRDWVCHSFDMAELPSCYHTIPVHNHQENISLTPDGSSLILVSGHDHWLLLREFDLTRQRCNRAFLLHAPQPFRLPQSFVFGEEIWISDTNAGGIVSLSLDPLTIHSWYDCRQVLREKDDVIEDLMLFPETRCVWIARRQGNDFTSEVQEIIDLDRFRIKRAVKSKDFPSSLLTGTDFSMVLPNSEKKSVQLWSAKGKIVEEFTLGNHGLMAGAVVHPNGGDYCFFLYDDTVDETDEMIDYCNLVVEIKPDVAGKYTPLIIKNSSGVWTSYTCTSLGSGLIFINFRTPEKEKIYLAALEPADHGLAIRYQVEVPDYLFMATDFRTQQVTALLIGRDTLQAVTLGKEAPDLIFPEKSHGNERIPRIDPFYVCNKLTGAANARAQAFTAMIEGKIAHGSLVAGMVADMMTDDTDPDDAVAFLEALKQRPEHFNEALAMGKWVVARFPDHPTARLHEASMALKQADWSQAVSLLEAIERDALDEGTACHVCHLLGIGLFGLGEMERAFAVWEEGMGYKDGACDLAPLISYASLTLVPREKRAELAHCRDDARVLHCYETTDHYLSEGKWLEAIAVMEQEYIFSSKDTALLVRFAEAYLQVDTAIGSPRWIGKVLALGHFLDNYQIASILEEHRQILPPFIASWSDERIASVAERCRLWLAQQSDGAVS